MHSCIQTVMLMHRKAVFSSYTCMNTNIRQVEILGNIMTSSLMFSILTHLTVYISTCTCVCVCIIVRAATGKPFWFESLWLIWMPWVDTSFPLDSSLLFFAFFFSRCPHLHPPGRTPSTLILRMEWTVSHAGLVAG